MTIQEALAATVMGNVIGTRRMLFARADGVEDYVTIEIGTPTEYQIANGMPLWTCSVRISLLPSPLPATGQSSLDAIINAVYLAAEVLKKHPYGAAIDMSLQISACPFPPSEQLPKPWQRSRTAPKRCSRLPSRQRRH